MNKTMILRYAIEFSTVLPAAFLAILPVREYKRLITKFIVFMFVILMTPVSKFSEQQKYASTVLKEKKKHFLKKYDDHRKPQKIIPAKYSYQ